MLGYRGETVRAKEEARETVYSKVAWSILMLLCDQRETPQNESGKSPQFMGVGVLVLALLAECGRGSFGVVVIATGLRLALLRWFGSGTQVGSTKYCIAQCVSDYPPAEAQ